MRRVGASEARNCFGTLLDRVAGGEHVIITRLGRDVARLMPVYGRVDRGMAKSTARALTEVSRGLSLGGQSIKRLVSHGRR